MKKYKTKILAEITSENKHVLKKNILREIS